MSKITFALQVILLACCVVTYVAVWQLESDWSRKH